MSIGIVDHCLPYDAYNTYDVLFYGDTISTTLTHDPEIACRWISETESIHRRRLSHLIVGLDVEWRPSFNRHVQYPAATLQLSVGRRCLIFQLIHCISNSIPVDLVNFLANPNYMFVGIGIDQDLEKLQEDYGFGFNANAVDLRELAAEAYGRNDLKNAGLKTLASVVLDKEVEKPKRVTMSRWDNPWLTPSQVQYACVDAYVCFEIGRILNASASSSGEQVIPSLDALGFYIVAFVVGSCPGQGAVDSMRKSWGVANRVYRHQSGWMIFKFQNEEDREKVLGDGPYSSYGCPWVLNKMPKKFQFDDERFHTIPVWVQLRNLPLECWTSDALSSIGSQIGSPISTDKITHERSNPAYARLLVEVDVREPMVSAIPLVLPNGKAISVLVHYETKTTLCGKCKSIGHSEDTCDRATTTHRGRSRSKKRQSIRRGKTCKSVSVSFKMIHNEQPAAAASSGEASVQPCSNPPSGMVLSKVSEGPTEAAAPPGTVTGRPVGRVAAAQLKTVEENAAEGVGAGLPVVVREGAALGEAAVVEEAAASSAEEAAVDSPAAGGAVCDTAAAL